MSGPSCLIPRTRWQYSGACLTAWEPETRTITSCLRRRENMLRLVSSEGVSKMVMAG